MIRASRIRFTAINESGYPLLVALFEAARESPAIRNAMLALAGCLRTATGDDSHAGDAAPSASPSPAESAAAARYQASLGELRGKISDFQHGRAAGGDATEILGCVMMLIIAGFPSTVGSAGPGDWALHIAGMVSLVESLDARVIGATAIGRMSRELAAQLSIGAFSLGCQRSLGCAWLEWGIHPPDVPQDPDFSPLEIIRGYPKSLLTIMAALSAVLEQQADGQVDPLIGDTVQKLYDAARQREGAAVRSPGHGPYATFQSPAWTSGSLLSMLETALTVWGPPDIPSRMSVGVVTALTNAWEVMRKAALIYLWRGGFGTELTASLSPRNATTTAKYVKEMLLVLRALLHATDEQGITVMNSMTWPIMVIGNESGTSPDIQGEILSLLQGMERRFSMPHLSHLSDILRTLWQRAGQTSHGLDEINVSLEGIARETGACLPLF